MSNHLDKSFFARLLAPMLMQLKRIAGASRGEHSLEDLKAEAWIAAHEIQAEEGTTFEPEDEQFQNAIVARLRKAFGQFSNRVMRFALQLDHEKTGDDGDLLPNSVAARLAGPDTYEPDIAVERAQERDSNDVAISERFAEAVAYLRTLDNFDHDLDALASHLAIPITTLRTRMHRAEVAAANQPSMFDGVVKIPADFVPLAGFARAAIRPQRLWRSRCAQRRPLQLRIFSLWPSLFGRRMA